MQCNKGTGRQTVGDADFWVFSRRQGLPVIGWHARSLATWFRSGVSALYGTRSRLACSTGRSPPPLRHRAEKCPAGVAPAYPTRQVGASAARPRTQSAGTHGVEPCASALETDCSPRSTSLIAGGRCPQAVPAGVEPAPVWLTASRTTSCASGQSITQFRRLGSNQRPPRFQRGALTE